MSREAIAERAIDMLESSVVIATDKGSELREARHNGFKVWFWPMPERNQWALRIHDQTDAIVFRSYFNKVDRTYSIEKCKLGAWRDEFMAVQQ